MPQFTVITPETVTGVKSYEILLSSDYGPIIFEMDILFKNYSKNSQIRKSYAMPTDENHISDVEDWQFNEKLSCITWRDLSLENATLLLANYYMLSAEEKFLFQPLLWRYLLYSSEWNTVFSNIIFWFFYDRNETTSNFKNFCSTIQNKAIVRCLEMLVDKLLNKDFVIEDCLVLEEEVDVIKNVIIYWRKDL